MSNISSINKKYGIGKVLRFKQIADGIAGIEIDNDLVTASISLMGAQMLTWRPKCQKEPVLWLSKKAQYIPGKPIRGGVPLCWPWFGPSPSNTSLPGHGFARIVQWEVASTNMDASGVIEIVLTLAEIDVHEDLHPYDWPKSVELSARMLIGEKLEVALTTINKSNKEIKYTEGMHTYFNVGDIAQVRVNGLEECEYIDLKDGNVRRRQSGPLVFNGEMSRIFVNYDKRTVIEDPKIGRTIEIESIGSRSIAVWNPWLEAARKMIDLGNDGWRSMVCVETANALDNSVILSPEQCHTTISRYSVTALK